ncbi:MULTISPECIES: N-acetyl sugar amidotransferase [Thalassospira]|uniref:N-acetyl sugar amidotransferase n=1 Tax=Thalassospira povalilytica TaxID=732237 RepID=A0A8I1M6J6_9PROT|nr:N-acetyl sugar amidotransferase [Thalassospira povalilytica]MBN8195899.1 N-acetyl sugar amidotransferase [Thalassospira povalilytica]PKR52347.1 N-acetyl sugar amidotransferase [Thalassospira povalilytica]
MLRYCTKCLYPHTKPDLGFDEHGVCSACNAFNQRKEVDWELREKEFLQVVEAFRSRDGASYDCIVPVSGGKDSTYQVIKLLQYGLNPLCVTGTTDSLSALGRRNIDNIKSLGVDYIEYSFNPIVRRKLNRICLEQTGDISWPEHVAIFTTPVRMAVKMGIKLIVWGENPQHEYGGPAASQNSKHLDRRWLEEYGGLLGLRVSDLIGQMNIQNRDLIPYMYPSDQELEKSGVTGIFLGYYFPWDGLSNALIAQAYGFEVSPTIVEGSLACYENLDNHQTGIHDYFKFLKFGFGRATDIASNHVRRGRILRKDALEMVKRHDGKYPHTCLGKPLDEILCEIDMSRDEFERVCDRFTNKRIFKRDDEGNILRSKDSSPLKINWDNM